MKSMPGLKGVDHMGLTVPDIEAATAFFVDVLGCEPIYDVGPFRSDTDWMKEYLNVDPRAEIPKLRLLKCADGPSIELFEYKVSAQKRDVPKNSDVGGHHLAFYVDDMAQAVRFLRDRNVHVLGEPVKMTEGPSAGLEWVYFLAPWGLQLELVSYPKGQAFEASSGMRVWRPR